MSVFKISLRNMFAKYIEGTIFETIFYILGCIMFILIVFVSIVSIIKHYSIPKCRHGNREICYFCEQEELHANTPRPMG